MINSPCRVLRQVVNADARHGQAKRHLVVLSAVEAGEGDVQGTRTRTLTLCGLSIARTVDAGENYALTPQCSNCRAARWTHPEDHVIGEWKY